MSNLVANVNGEASSDNDRPEPVAGMLKVAAGLTLYIGVSGVIGGLAHLQGVIANATTRGYPYNFRLAALLLVGILLAYVGVLCLSAVRGLVAVNDTPGTAR